MKPREKAVRGRAGEMGTEMAGGSSEEERSREESSEGEERGGKRDVEEDAVEAEAGCGGGGDEEEEGALAGSLLRRRENHEEEDSPCEERNSGVEVAEGSAGEDGDDMAAFGAVGARCSFLLQSALVLVLEETMSAMRLYAPKRRGRSGTRTLDVSEWVRAGNEK